MTNTTYKWIWREMRRLKDFAALCGDPGDSVEALTNGLYDVIVRRCQDGSAHLTISDPQRRHRWDHYQRIKDDLLGPEWCAIEIYPPHDALVDEANLYHLWCRPTMYGDDWTPPAAFMEFNSIDSKFAKRIDKRRGYLRL